MPRIFRAIGDELNQRFNRKKASSTNELIGFRDNGAVVSRDRRGTLKVEIPNVSEKSETLGSDPLAIYKPSGAKQADRRERLPKGLDLGKPESVESCGRKLASIERSAGWRHREELIV
jgi:hypothetical protein